MRKILGRESRQRVPGRPVPRVRLSEPAESVLAALGIEGNSKCVRGPGEEAQEKVAKSVFFEKGDLYKCPCGWCPDTKKKSWVHEATRHWRRCQGREKPKMTPETKAQVYGRTSVIIAARKRKRVIKEYRQWRQSIPNEELREAFCDLEEDRMERRVQKYCTVTMFGCSRCAQVKTCQDAKRSLCSRRPSSVTKNSSNAERRILHCKETIVWESVAQEEVQRPSLCRIQETIVARVACKEARTEMRVAWVPLEEDTNQRSWPSEGVHGECDTP